MDNRSLKSLVLAAACLLVITWAADASAAGSYRQGESRSDIGFKGWGPRLGFVDPDGPLDGTAELGVVFELGEFTPHLKWDASVSFWSTGRRYFYHNNNQDYWYDWRLRDFILRTGVNYMFTDGEWIPYLGGGIGIHSYSWDYNDSPFYNNVSETRVGFYIDGGIEHQFTESWTGQMQVQFDSADLDQTALLLNLIYRLR